ncbi:MAG: hypothetical protein LBG11_03275 [Bifidobacteriaceae bacterium]|jgi:hypothetical protein|nr:hypothetical protein [Bifidobacteriaceae bacterium]
MSKSFGHGIAVAAVIVGAYLATAGCSAYSQEGGESPADERTAKASSQTARTPDAETEAPPSSAGPTLEGVEFEWRDYEVGFKLVSDDPQQAGGEDDEWVGKPVKILFTYLGGPGGADGFDLPNLRQDLSASPITLEQADGTVYEPTPALGDLLYCPDGGELCLHVVAIDETANLSLLSPIQPEFSIWFDIPTDAQIEDFQLKTGSGESVPLVPYVSDAYLAEHSDSE